MTLRRQNILYIVLIYLKIKSSAGYVQSNLAEVSLKGIEYNDAVKLWSSLTETKQNLFSSNSLVKDSIDPDVDVDRRKGFEEVAVDYNINVTSVLWKNASLNYALIDSEGRTSAEDNLKIEKIQSEEVDLLCAEGHDNNWNSTVANRTCFDDNLPCNATKAEYMQFLFDYLYPKTSEWILIFVHGLVFITGLVGNALVCIAVYTNYSMRTVTNVFIVNLAVADFLVILVCLPPSVVWDVTETWFLGQSMCKIVLYFQTVSVTVSVLTLTFISVDRWYAICFPLRYRTKISRAIASVSFIWIVALLSDIPEFLALHLKKPKLRFESVLFTQCGTTWDLQTEMNFYLTQLVLLYILPLMLMMIAYFKIVRILWKSDTIPGHRESRTHQYSCGYLRGNSTMVNSSTMGQLRARRKAAKMLVAVVVMFATCYFPVHVFNLLRYTGNLHGGEITTIFSLCSHWLCYANSAVNPVIYNFMSGKFRREFRNALDKCRCGRIRVEDRSFNQSNPLSRLHNISPSIRSNYNLTSVRDITLTRESSRQTMQTTFVENNGNGHSINTPILSSNKDL
ncbi:orexin/Hypocretin receptor type 1-like isoform X2 [Episyrphus balteatus]|uniref:orexin/Hypocretin receptor type 1-like isoform X2 n=1 Tax=Episyrphus balteatus TaxID=286459 RepID=UPI0024856023|nr:orexin/Hypocretin receptor type 1-like isoform X2 [Episyrphus balteatus]